MADFVTVAAFDAAPDAYIIKGLLEQAGIPAFINNEHLVGVQWLYSNAVGGVQVQVPAEHAAAALEVLRAGQEESPEQERDAPVCPRCGIFVSCIKCKIEYFFICILHIISVILCKFICGSISCRRCVFFMKT